MSQNKGAAPTGVRYAGPGRRLKAFALDYLVILAYILVLGGLNYGLILMGGRWCARRASSCPGRSRTPASITSGGCLLLRKNRHQR